MRCALLTASHLKLPALPPAGLTCAHEASQTARRLKAHCCARFGSPAPQARSSCSRLTAQWATCVACHPLEVGAAGISGVARALRRCGGQRPPAARPCRWHLRWCTAHAFRPPARARQQPRAALQLGTTWPRVHADGPTGGQPTTHLLIMMFLNIMMTVFGQRVAATNLPRNETLPKQALADELSTNEAPRRTPPVPRPAADGLCALLGRGRSEEHTSELQSL